MTRVSHDEREEKLTAKNARRCPVCWSRYVPDRQFTNTGRHFVTLHRDGVGRYCPMSGKWFGLEAER